MSYVDDALTGLDAAWLATRSDIVSLLSGWGDTSLERRLAIREGLAQPNALEQIPVLKGLKTKLDEIKTAATGASPSDPLAPMDAADGGMFSIDT